jgi:dolichol-phosphate mannosyltransferase
MKNSNLRYGFSIPFSNEGLQAVKFLEKIRTTISRFDIVVCLVDKKTQFKTVSFIEKFVLKKKNFHILNCKNSKNFTETRLEGLRFLKKKNCDYFFDLDGNGAHKSFFIRYFKKKISQNKNEAVFGSRFLKMKVSFKGTKNYKRILLSYFGVKLANFLLAAKFTDTGGYVCFSKKCLETLLKHKFHSPGHFFHYELKYLLRNNRFEEIPISYEKSSSQITLIVVLKALKSLILLFFKKY